MGSPWRIRVRRWLHPLDHLEVFVVKKNIKRDIQISKMRREEGEFLKENINALSNLENAYMTSRYLPAEFYREEVEGLMEVALSIFKLVKEHV
ncbi:MAG: HEPN domain-containing protein [Candidatus Korarchaeota archaeon]|nr:HEPN domain-containing protein [Candidatus Korarchaeota archaeon]